MLMRMEKKTPSDNIFIATRKCSKQNAIDTQYNHTLKKINEAKGTQKSSSCYDLPCLACGNITKKDISFNKLGDCYKLCYRQNTSKNNTVIDTKCKNKWNDFNDFQKRTLKEAQREYLKRNGIDKFKL
jgi:hypothetical protein